LRVKQCRLWKCTNGWSCSLNDPTLGYPNVTHPSLQAFSLGHQLSPQPLAAISTYCADIECGKSAHRVVTLSWLLVMTSPGLTRHAEASCPLPFPWRPLLQQHCWLRWRWDRKHVRVLCLSPEIKALTSLYFWLYFHQKRPDFLWICR